MGDECISLILYYKALGDYNNKHTNILEKYNIILIIWPSTRKVKTRNKYLIVRRFGNLLWLLLFNNNCVTIDEFNRRPIHVLKCLDGINGFRPTTTG